MKVICVLPATWLGLWSSSDTRTTQGCDELFYGSLRTNQIGADGPAGTLAADPAEEISMVGSLSVLLRFILVRNGTAA